MKIKSKAVKDLTIQIEFDVSIGHIKSSFKGNFPVSFIIKETSKKGYLERAINQGFKRISDEYACLWPKDANTTFDQININHYIVIKSVKILDIIE